MIHFFAGWTHFDPYVADVDCDEDKRYGISLGNNVVLYG
jgi:hypothetical protein